MKNTPLVVSLLLLICAGAIFAKYAAPKVQIYSRAPGLFGKPNMLLCHASMFYPPELNITLLQDGGAMEGAHQTELAFEESWFYHLTEYASFTPQKEHKYSCQVSHQGETKTYHWGETKPGLKQD
ncbi:unnamed protein product [Knipowitschia caucasica]|uniref:Beta-2-microglobulin n=1 Tax=Knipowitschia caucasica TaxID=637954 RepID=A0AAV2ITA2_KNICA